MANEQSYIAANKEGRVTAYVGEAATNLARAITAKAALNFYAKTGMMITRTVNITGLLQIAGEYTGKRYKRTQALIAVGDLAAWLEAQAGTVQVREN